MMNTARLLEPSVLHAMKAANLASDSEICQRLSDQKHPPTARGAAG